MEQVPRAVALLQPWANFLCPVGAISQASHLGDAAGWNVFMRTTLAVINQMQADGVIGKYAIGEAVGATFYLEPAAMLDIDVFVSFQKADSLLTVSPIYDYLTARAKKNPRTERQHEVLISGGV